MFILKVLGWIFVPFVMVFIRWKKQNKIVRVAGVVWGVLALLIWIGALFPKGDNAATPPQNKSGNSAIETSSNVSASTAPKTEAKSTKPKTPKVDKTMVDAKTFFDEKNLNKLLEIQKTKSSNLSADNQKKLSDWITSLEKEWKDQTKKDMAYMKVDKDEVTGVTFYTDKTSAKSINENALYAYIATKKGSDPVLRIKIQYFGSDWLFIQQYIFNIDGTDYNIIPQLGQVQRDNNTSVWEWYDQPANGNTQGILSAIAISKKTILRYQGKQYYKDRIIPKSEKQAITNVLNLYSDLKEEAKWNN